MKKILITAIIVQFLIFCKETAAAGCYNPPDRQNKCDLSEGFVSLVMKCKDDGKCLTDIKKAITSGIDINGVNACIDYSPPPGIRIMDYCPGGGPTALFVAQTSSIRHLLIKSGADVNATDGNDRTALFFVKDREAIDILIKAGADINKKDRFGRTVLFYKKSPELVDALIKAGADVNARNEAGQTPLHMTTLFKGNNAEADIQKIKILLASGADVNAKDIRGKTSLEYAREGQLDPSVIDLLVKAGAK